MNPRFEQSIADGHTLVTAGARLARRLLHRHARACLERGLRAWETPDILSFDAWLERCWREQPPTARTAQLLNRAQSDRLWLEVVRNSRQRARLLHPASVAREAARAWTTLQQWNAPPFPDTALLNEDARAFAGWALAFRERCAAEHWLDPAALPAAVRALLEQSGAPRPVQFVGFDSLTPAQESLARALAARKAWVNAPAAPQFAARPPAAGYADRRAEMIAAAHWVRDGLAGGARRSVGIVMPDLAARRNLAEDVFEDVLHPGALRSPAPDSGRCYSIALGRPLAEHPLIATALAGLALGRGTLGLAAAGALLRSPFMQRSGDERVEAACIEAQLRARGDAEVDLAALLAAAAAIGAGRAAEPALLPRLRRLRELLEQAPRSQSLHDWAATFSRLLSALGWPGARALDSGEYQAAESWRAALGELATLDLIGGATGYHAAWAELKRLLGARNFQPRTAETPVEVLGLEGAADMGFDRLWVMGLDEGAWPPPARPSPFIPLRMQRDLRMPLATPELALAHARAVTQRLAQGATEVIFSHPCMDGEAPLRPSPLLAAVGPAPMPAGPVDYLRQLFAPQQLEQFSDERGPPLSAGAQGGGAALLRDQAACPFRAFARHRLGARPVDPIDIGLDAMSRGSLVHRVLELVWMRLRDQGALLALDSDALEQLLAQVVAQAVSAVQQRRPRTLSPRFAAVEQARLRRLLRGWLELERTRAPFTVEACEAKHETQIGGLRLRLRVDRLDRLADGRHLILDYKTGAARLGDWSGERPDEPQLPLYAVSAATPVAALAFAQLRPGAHGFVGAGSEAGLLPGLKAASELGAAAGESGWNELLARWRHELEALVAEFAAGEARVDPKRAQSCQTCDLHALCRINESQPWLEAEDD